MRSNFPCDVFLSQFYTLSSVLVFLLIFLPNLYLIIPKFFSSNSTDYNVHLHLIFSTSLLRYLSQVRSIFLAL